MANETKMIEGVRVFAPHANAPDFVLASVVITPNALYEFLKANPDMLSEYDGKKQIKMQLLRSKEGKLYMKHDDYKPGEKKQETPASTPGDGDLPF